MAASVFITNMSVSLSIMVTVLEQFFDFRKAFDNGSHSLLLDY